MDAGDTRRHGAFTHNHPSWRPEVGMKEPDSPAAIPPGAPIPTASPEEPAGRRLQSGPQTAIDPATLPNPIREQVAVIAGDAAGTHGAGTEDAFIPVYYLPEDEAAAIDLFVQLNAHRLTALDLTGTNPLKRHLSVRVYSRVLVAAGRRSVTRYDNVVVERRPDGTAWLVTPEWYDAHPADRYTPGAHAARIPPDVDLQRLYYSSGPVVSKATVHATPIDGNAGLVLLYYRDVDAYHCRPELTDDTPILRKVDATDDGETTS